MTPQEKRDYEEAASRWYADARKVTVEGERAQNNQFDRTVVSLASGAFGLSLAFISTWIGNHTPIAPWSILTSWILFGLSIVSTLWSFRTSANAYRKQREAIDNTYKQMLEAARDETKPAPKEVKELKARSRKMTRFLNIASSSLFTGGVLFMLYFVARNLLRLF